MRFLVFRLYGPLVSFGEPAVGEVRPSHTYPGRSAILGMLAAALGVRRDEEARHVGLADAYGVAVAMYAEGSLLRDYHTAQVPSAKGLRKRPHRTRADELAVPKPELSTILSIRDYRQDALSLVLVWSKTDTAPHTLEELGDALHHPRFALYLGRKACPPALPLHPQIIEAETLDAALSKASFPPLNGLRNAGRLRRLSWEDGVDPGLPVTYSVPRKDTPLSRRRWQFSDRREHVALIAEDRPSEEPTP